MSSISSVAAGAGTAVLTNSSVAVAIGKPGQSVEPSGSASATVSVPYYTSPRIFVDPQYGEVVYDYRDPTTGASTSQIPSRQQLTAYQAQQTTFVSTASGGVPSGGTGTAGASLPVGTSNSGSSSPAPAAVSVPATAGPVASTVV